MLGRTRRSKGKHSLQSKKSKAKQRTAAIASQQQVVAQIQKPAAPTSVTASSIKVPVSTPTSRIVRRYPYITAELRRIGILAGIIIIILIVLALVLS